GEINKDSIATKVYYKPAMSIVWLGSILIAAGSFLAALPCGKQNLKSHKTTLLS
ncbi:MAG TPA: hypothetical protein DEQ74_00270, partial [Wolbachia sp.]|nr:hypothetical protein [Wolbachia sp.]